ncbi:MAG: DEAD/DEAH box helicase, partial [Lentisphaeria bacterium]|nr:DEAD/DEAH box helicase [Lentisphaeria bacterium]
MPSPITTKFAKHFAESVQAHGRDLVAQGRATCVFAGHERLACEVLDDSQAYTVQLNVINREMIPECDCDTFAGGAVCAHVWAALLLAEQHQELGAATKRGCAMRQPAKLENTATATPPAEAEHCYDYGNRRQRRRQQSPPVLEQPRAETYLEFEPQNRRPTRTGATIPAVDPAAAPILYVLRLENQPEDGQALLLETWWRPSPTTTPGAAATPCRPFLPEPDSSVPTAADQSILTCLREERARSCAEPPYDRLPPHVFPVRGVRLAALADLLAATGRARWLSIKERPPRFHALAFPMTLPVDFAVTMTTLPNNTYQAAGGWQTATEFIPGLDAQAVFADGFAILRGQWRPVKLHRALTLAQRFRNEPPLLLDARAAQAFARQLAIETDLPTDAFPPEVRCRRQLGRPVGRLYVRTARFLHEGHEQLHAELSFEYEDAVCPEDHATNQFPVIRPNLVIARDQDAEDTLRERLRQLGFRWNARPGAEEAGWKLAPARLEPAVMALVMEGWTVNAEGKTYRRPTVKPPTVTSGLDWFDLRAEVDYQGLKAPLPKLLAAARRGAQAVLLDDGTYGLLPREWLEQYTALLEIGESADDRIRFRQHHAALIQAFLQDRAAETDARFQATLAALESFSGAAPAPAPTGFKATLRPYQEIGLGWLLAMHRLGLGACLADDMGLGKTVQTLAFLATVLPAAGKRPALIVMPKSLIFNWQAEIRQFTPWLKAVCYGGPGRRDPRRAFRGCDLVLTTYGTMRQDALKLAEIDFEVCVLDESQAIKNRDSATAQAARALQARHRLVMTGTPVENHLGELFSQLDFLNPGLLGKTGANANTLPGDAASLARLRQGVRPFILRRTKREVAPELPPKTEQVIWCELEDEQRQVYDELKDFYRQTLLGENASNGMVQDTTSGTESPRSGGTLDVLSALLRLRQAACHPGLIQEAGAGVPSAKLMVLRERLAAIAEEGHKALVFSQFTSFLKLAATQLAADGIGHCYLDDATTERGALVESFQTDPGLAVFLISLKAGG